MEEWQRIAENWTAMAPMLRAHWQRLTSDDLKTIAGKRDVLLGKLMEKYPVDRRQAERDLETWMESVQKTAKK